MPDMLSTAQTFFVSYKRTRFIQYIFNLDGKVKEHVIELRTISRYAVQVQIHQNVRIPKLKILVSKCRKSTVDVGYKNRLS